MKYFLIPVLALMFAASCNTVDLYEKTVSIPGHAWSNTFRPEFTFDIRDSSSLYQVYLVLRHTEKYNYSNIYINLSFKGPGQDTAQHIRQSVDLAGKEGWLGQGMDDIYEQRRPLGPPQSLHAGTYHFTVEQIMRDNPLEQVLDVGIRVEKKP